MAGVGGRLFAVACLAACCGAALACSEPQKRPLDYLMAQYPFSYVGTATVSFWNDIGRDQRKGCANPEGDWTLVVLDKNSCVLTFAAVWRYTDTQGECVTSTDDMATAHVLKGNWNDVAEACFFTSCDEGSRTASGSLYLSQAASVSCADRKDGKVDVSAELARGTRK